MSKITVPDGQESGPDYQATLPVIEGLFSAGKYSQGLLLALDTLRQAWAPDTSDKRQQFAEAVVVLLPEPKRRKEIIDGLRKAAHKEYLPPPKPDPPDALAFMRAYMKHLVKSSMPPGSGEKELPVERN